MKTNNDGKYALPLNYHSDLDYEHNVLDYMIKNQYEKTIIFSKH
jgi:hypothetical protein